MKDNEPSENSNNSYTNNSNQLPDSELLSDDFFTAIKTSKKINDKKKKIDELAKSLKENPSYLNLPQNQQKVSDLYNLIISNLNENNNNYVSSQIKLIDILINNNDINNSQNFKNFSKLALPKLFDKFYLQNQKINESLTGVLGKFIDNKILNMQDYYTHIENISLDEEDNYKDNIMDLLKSQIEKNKDITADKIPKGINDIVNRLTEDSDDNVSDKAKNLLNILKERNPIQDNNKDEKEKYKDKINEDENIKIEDKKENINNNENIDLSGTENNEKNNEKENNLNSAPILQEKNENNDIEKEKKEDDSKKENSETKNKLVNETNQENEIKEKNNCENDTINKANADDKNNEKTLTENPENENKNELKIINQDENKNKNSEIKIEKEDDKNNDKTPKKEEKNNEEKEEKNINESNKEKEQKEDIKVIKEIKEEQKINEAKEIKEENQLKEEKDKKEEIKEIKEEIKDKKKQPKINEEKEQKEEAKGIKEEKKEIKDEKKDIKEEKEIKDKFKEIKEENEKKEEKEINKEKETNNNDDTKKEKEKSFDEEEENQLTEIPEIKIDEDLLNIDNIKSGKKEELENKKEEENKNKIEDNKENTDENNKETVQNLLKDDDKLENIIIDNNNQKNKENEKIVEIKNEKETKNIENNKDINIESKEKENKNETTEKENKVIDNKKIEEETSHLNSQEKEKDSSTDINKTNENNNDNNIKIDKEKNKENNSDNNPNELIKNQIKENPKESEDKNKENKDNDLEKKDDKKEEQKEDKNNTYEKKESNNENNDITMNINKEAKKEGLKRSAIQGKLNKFRKQFGKTRKSKNLDLSFKEDTKSDVIKKNSSVIIANNLEEVNKNSNINENENNISKEKKSFEINTKINENDEISRKNTLEEMFRKKIEDGFDTETNNILDLGKSHNNNNNLDILNEIQGKLGIDFNEVNKNDKNNNEENNINNNEETKTTKIENNINENNKEIKDNDNNNDAININEEINKKENPFENPHDSKKIVNPDDRPIHPSKTNFNFDLDFDEQENAFLNQESNNKEKAKAKKTNSSRLKSFFEDKDLEELGKMNKKSSNSNNSDKKKIVSAEIEYKNKDKEIHPFSIENNGEKIINDKSKDENDINNINNAINNLNNTINKIEKIHINKNKNEDERRPKIKTEDFQKKLELALEQEQALGDISGLDMNKDNENETEKDNKKSKEYIEDPRFDNIKEKLGKEIIDSLMSKRWESKKHGYELINTFIESNSLNYSISNDLYEYIRFKLKNFKETNFNVNREAINVFITLTKKNLINKDNLISIIIAYYDKITDSKLKENFLELLNSSMTIIEPQPILKQLLMKITKKNNAKLFIEYSLLFGKITEDYNNKELPYKEMTEFCKIMANNNNPQCRNASMNLICILYKYYGEEIHKLIKDIKESTLKNIEAELSKITVIEKKTHNLKPRKSIRKISKENIESKNTSINGGEKGLNGAEKKEIKPNIPIDISKKITPQILKNISNGKWAEKKDACETIEKLLKEANMKILPNGLNDLMNLIKEKLVDGNKNIVRMMVNLLTQLIESLKQGFKQWSKYMALNLIPNLSDKNQILRNECQICFDKWVEFVGFDSLIIYFPPFLKNGNVEIRTEIMNFIKKNKDKFNKEIGLLIFKDKEMIGNLLLCLQDKTSSVRAQAEETIKFSLNYIKLNHYYSKIKEYKPAITNDLQIILDKIQSEINGENSNSEAKTENINENTNNNINNTNDNSNIKDEEKNVDDKDIENEGNININELLNINNNQNNGNGATNQKNSNKNNSKKKDDSKFLKSNSTIINSDSRKNSINSVGFPNKKFKKVINKSTKSSLNNSISSENKRNKSKEKEFKEKSGKTKELSGIKGTFKTCTNFNKKKILNKEKDNDRASPLNKSGKKDISSNSKILNSNDKRQSFQKSVMPNRINNLNEEKLKTQRKVAAKRLGFSKNRGLTNSLILKKSEFKLSKKDGNSIFMQNIKLGLNKSKRLEKDLKFKFSLDYICRDTSMKSKLKDLCKNLFVDDFHKTIFSDDFKMQVIALKEMKEQIDKKINIQIYLDNLDLILKVLGVYLNGNLNPTIVKNLLEFFESLYNIIEEKNYILNEIEINIIMTLLIDKLSINNYTLKQHSFNLLDEYIELNEKNKTMITVLNIALSKNSKIKTDILDFTIELYKNKNLNIMSKQYVKIFGKYICSNDNVVKAKVLLLFKQQFSVIGNELFDLLDFLTDKDKKYLENNLYADNDDDFDDEEEEIEIGSQHSLGMNLSDDEENEEDEKENQNNDENYHNNKSINSINNSKENNTNIVNGAADSNNDILSLISNLLSKNHTDRVKTIVIIHDIITQQYEEKKQMLIKNIDNIICIFIKVTHELFIETDIHKIQIRFAKYLSIVLLKIATIEELISKISFNVLYKLTIELLSYLLIKDFDKIGENKEDCVIFKSVNSTILRIIDNCNKNCVILVFLEILKKYQRDEDKKIVSVAVKCLLKCTGKLEDIINILDIGKILIELNVILYRYEKLYPELKNQYQADAYIIKFIKNFVCNITKYKKDNIIEIYNDSVKKSEMEDKLIIYWIKGTLDIFKKSDKNSNISPKKDISNNSSNNNKDMNDEEKNNEQKKEENKNEENDDKNKGNNTIDQLKKKWNDVKPK